MVLALASTTLPLPSQAPTTTIQQRLLLQFRALLSRIKTTTMLSIFLITSPFANFHYGPTASTNITLIPRSAANANQTLPSKPEYVLLTMK